MNRLLIGVGTRHRCDDQAGILVASRVRSMPATVTTDCTELEELWDGYDEVVIVDAARMGARPGQIVRFDVTATPLPSRGFVSSHSFGLAEAIELARVSGCLPRSVTVYGIQGVSFQPGDDVTPPVAAAVSELVGMIDAGSRNLAPAAGQTRP